MKLSDHVERLLETAIEITSQATAVIALLGEDADAVGVDGTDNAKAIANARTSVLG